MRQYGDTSYVEILRNYNGRTFGFASRNFYVAFLAAMAVDQDPEKYFPGVTPEQPTQYAQAALSGYIAVNDLSAALGVTPSQLARHNPSLQATVWQGSKNLPKGFDVRMPASTLDSPIDELLAQIPAQQWSSEQLPDLFHTVVRGDTLSQIAETYKTRVSTLSALNNLGSRHRIRAGQQLRLPAAGPAPAVIPAPAIAIPTVADAIVVESPIAVESPVVVADTDPGTAAVALETSVSTTALENPLLADPSDYSVANDLTIEVQALETLGHFADWLGIRTQRLRDINGLAFRTPLAVGQRIELEIADIDISTFEGRRIAYHRAEQDGFFREHIITGVAEHVIKSGESVWILSLRQYDVPIWLFRQYNPGLDLHRIRPGVTVRFPILADSSSS